MYFGISESGLLLRKLAHAMDRDSFKLQKLKIPWKNFDVFNICVQNIDCGYTLEPVTSTHNLCFASKIIKVDIPPQTAFLHIKMGF